MHVKFVGEYSKLRDLGYTFQKLYAENVMTWHKGDIFIFKKGSVVKYASVTQQVFRYFISLIKSGKRFDELATTNNFLNYTRIVLFHNNETDEIHMDMNKFNDWQKQSFSSMEDQSFNHGLWSTHNFSINEWNEIQMLIDRGWLEII